MSALIYVETSIPSFYHETRPETKFQAMREWTREWWDIARLRDELVTSQAVLLELGRAPEPKRDEGIALIEPLPLPDALLVRSKSHSSPPKNAKTPTNPHTESPKIRERTISSEEKTRHSLHMRCELRPAGMRQGCQPRIPIFAG